jgi:hypothetical protein
MGVAPQNIPAPIIIAVITAAAIALAALISGAVVLLL